MRAPRVVLVALAVLLLAPLGAAARRQPDLVVEDVWVEVLQAYTFALKARVRNAGDADAASSHTLFLLDGSEVRSCSTDGAIPAGASIVCEVWASDVAGEHVVSAVADAGEVVNESDESNNARSASAFFFAPGEQRSWTYATSAMSIRAELFPTHVQASVIAGGAANAAGAQLARVAVEDAAGLQVPFHWGVVTAEWPGRFCWEGDATAQAFVRIEGLCSIVGARLGAPASAGRFLIEW